MADEPRDFPGAADLVVFDGMDPAPDAGPDEQMLERGLCPECGQASAFRRARWTDTVTCGWCEASFDVAEADEGPRVRRRIGAWRRRGRPDRVRPGRPPRDPA